MFAIMHISIHALSFDGSGFDDCGLDDDEIQKCVDAVHSLAIKISKKYPVNMGHNNEILNFVRNNV